MNVKGKYLNPKADLTFKLIFGEHKDLVMSLLNALLPLPDDGRIESVEYISNELVPDNPGKKNSIVDVQCMDSQGRRFIVEMQNLWNVSFVKRVMLNTAKAIVKQVGQGEDFTKLQPVYSLNLLNQEGFDTETEEFYHDYVLTNVSHHEKTLESIRVIFVELLKFKPKSIAERKMAVLWLRFLTEISEDTGEVPAELLENAETCKAMQILEKSAYSDSQLHNYQNFWYTIHSERVLEETGHAKGLAEGLEQGRAEGLEQGRAEGLEQGRAEGQLGKAREIACSMKAEGLGVQQIVRLTGLSAAEIAAL